MGIKVSADGLSIVTTKSDGKCMATIPDVCNIPGPNGPISVPFSNMAESKNAQVTSVMTQLNGGTVACMGSYCEPSTGDEGGILQGVASGTTKGKATFLLSSPTVIVESRPVCRKSDLMIMNEFNTIGLSGMNQEDVGPTKEFKVETKTLEIELKDEEGNPIPDAKYIVKHSGKITDEGNLDSNGFAKIENIRGSGYKVSFPDYENAILEEQ